MNVYEKAEKASAWTTLGGGIAHITHRFEVWILGQPVHRLAGIVEGQSSSVVWDDKGCSIHGESFLSLAELIEKKKEPVQ
jgi:hypothetical protein